MTHSEALQKVSKLLRLATSSNPDEAALAASKAQELIDRYQIEAASLNYDQKEEEPIKDFGFDPLEEMNRRSSWKGRLALVVATHNACKAYTKSEGSLALIGRPSDVATVRYIYSWLCQEINRLVDRDCKGNGKTWINNYRLGVIDTISKRLHEQQQATKETVRQEAQQLAEQTGTDSTLALVKVNQAIAKVEQRLVTVQEWTRQNMRLYRVQSNCRSNGEARQAGRIAGNDVRFTKAKAEITCFD